MTWRSANFTVRKRGLRSDKRGGLREERGEKKGFTALPVNVFLFIIIIKILLLTEIWSSAFAKLRTSKAVCQLILHLLRFFTKLNPILWLPGFFFTFNLEGTMKTLEKV